jgi:hypothetical protein
MTQTLREEEYFGSLQIIIFQIYLQLRGHVNKQPKKQPKNDLKFMEYTSTCKHYL